MDKKIKSCDIGSLPFEGNFSKFLKDSEYFQQKVIESLMDKVRAGIDIPIYPQYRDMNEMFIEMISGVEKANNSYYLVEIPSLRYEFIPEVKTLKVKAKFIVENISRHIQAGICVTGPYTLSYPFRERTPEMFDLLGDAIKEIAKNNIFSEKNLEIKMFTLDEPIFGLVDDPRLDYSDGRDYLRKAWEKIFHEAKCKGVDTAIHLHSTTNRLFFEVGSLDIIGSHVDDFLYSSKSTKMALEQYDKFLNISICKTNFDELILGKIGKLQDSYDGVAKMWGAIKNGKVDPVNFLEDVKVMKERLKRISELVGIERVKYASPECGMKAFPTYRCALTCLHRVSEAVKMLE